MCPGRLLRYVDQVTQLDSNALAVRITQRIDSHPFYSPQGERLPDATMDHSNLPDLVSDRLLALEQELIELPKALENQGSPACSNPECSHHRHAYSVPDIGSAPPGHAE